MTQIDLLSWALGYFSGIAITVIMSIIAYISKDKGIPKDPNPWAKLDETVANIEKNCNELDILIDNLKKQRDERTRPN
jgi:hypothetical protein